MAVIASAIQHTNETDADNPITTAYQIIKFAVATRQLLVDHDGDAGEGNLEVSIGGTLTNFRCLPGVSKVIDLPYAIDAVYIRSSSATIPTVWEVGTIEIT